MVPKDDPPLVSLRRVSLSKEKAWRWGRDWCSSAARLAFFITGATAPSSLPPRPRASPALSGKLEIARFFLTSANPPRLELDSRDSIMLKRVPFLFLFSF